MAATESPPLVDQFIPEQSREYVSLVYALVLLWGLGDTFSTYFAHAATGAGAGEVNPWIDVLLAYNPVLVAVVKGAVVLYVGIILLEYRDIVQTVPGSRVWLTTLVVAGILVVVNNLAVGIMAVT